MAKTVNTPVKTSYPRGLQCNNLCTPILCRLIQFTSLFYWYMYRCKGQEILLANHMKSYIIKPDVHLSHELMERNRETITLAYVSGAYTHICIFAGFTLQKSKLKSKHKGVYVHNSTFAITYTKDCKSRNVREVLF